MYLRQNTVLGEECMAFAQDYLHIKFDGNIWYGFAPGDLGILSCPGKKLPWTGDTASLYEISYHAGGFAAGAAMNSRSSSSLHGLTAEQAEEGTSIFGHTGDYFWQSVFRDAFWHDVEYVPGKFGVYPLRARHASAWPLFYDCSVEWVITSSRYRRMNSNHGGQSSPFAMNALYLDGSVGSQDPDPDFVRSLRGEVSLHLPYVRLGNFSP
jgi:prepilin-type processing-associated H-X9-DG protein